MLHVCQRPCPLVTFVFKIRFQVKVMLVKSGPAKSTLAITIQKERTLNNS